MEDGLQINIPPLSNDDQLQIHFNVAWGSAEEDNIGHWLVVDLASGANFVELRGYAEGKLIKGVRSLYMLLVLIVASVLAVLVPFGPILLIGIAVALVAENYRQTVKMREDILAIKNHLGLMNKKEAEQYEIERQNKDVSQLSPDEMKSINQEIEAELEQNRKKNK